LITRDVRKIYEESPIFLPEFSHLNNKKEILFLAVEQGTGNEIRDILATIKPTEWKLTPSLDLSDVDIYYKIAVSYEYSQNTAIEEKIMIATLTEQFNLDPNTINGISYAKEKHILFFYVSNKQDWLKVLSTPTQTIEINTHNQGENVTHALSFIKIPSLADTNDPTIKKLFYKLNKHINKCADSSKPLIKHLTEKLGLKIIAGGTLRDQEKNNATSQGVLFTDVSTSLYLVHESPIQIFGKNSIICTLPKKHEKNPQNSSSFH